MGLRDVRAIEGEVIPGRAIMAGDDVEGASSTIGSTLKLQAGRLLFLAAVLILWQLTSGRWIDTFWISKPSIIWARLVEWVRSGFLFFQLGITLQEMVWGFLAGALTGIAAGFLLGLNPVLGKLMDPFITAVYSLPKVALAPLFVLWFGIGLPMKIVLAAVIVFFLVFWNTYAGVRDVDPELVDVLRVMGAKKYDVLQKVVLPGALSWIYVGLKLSIPYALIGAVVGEIIASNRGLGFVLEYSAGQFDTAGMFAALFVLMVIAMTLNEVLNRSESYVLRWKRAGR